MMWRLAMTIRGFANKTSFDNATYPTIDKGQAPIDGYIHGGSTKPPQSGDFPISMVSRATTFIPAHLISIYCSSTSS